METDIKKMQNHSSALEIQSESSKVFELVDDVILKEYVNHLENFDILPVQNEKTLGGFSDIRLFKITEMVYEKDEYATHKFASVLNAMTYTCGTVFLLLDAFSDRTDFYMGVKANDEKRTASSIEKALENILKGQFPGIKTSHIYEEEKDRLIKCISSESISSVSCIANEKDSQNKGKNENFIQGLEKLVYALQGKRYTAVIIANAASAQLLSEMRKGYEDIYSQLSPLANTQLSYATNESISISQSLTKGESFSKSSSDTQSKTHSFSHTAGSSLSKTEGTSVSQENLFGRISKVVGVVGAAVATVCTAGLAAPLLVGAGVGAVCAIGSKQKTKSQSTTESKNESETNGNSDTNSKTVGFTQGQNKNETSGNTAQQGSTKNITLTVQNKCVMNILKRIDQQIKRIEDCESMGMWESAAYFMSDDLALSEIAATTYRSIMQGEKSNVEISAINTWRKVNNKEKVDTMHKYITHFMHPVFLYKNGEHLLQVTPGSMVSSNELALQIGLPRKSVVGFRVSEHATFGKDVFKCDEQRRDLPFNSLTIGNIFDLGNEAATKLKLSIESLSMHTFITGSTGSGKSNTIYNMLNKLRMAGLKFMVIEPAKGEYKNVFGNEKGVHVYGTNPTYSNVFRINPFKFSEGVHVLEHVDKLIDIFNVCWPMYAAMPSVLKDAVLRSYESCGWDLNTSVNLLDNVYYPTFQDLLHELVIVMNLSSYSEEVKGNYTGSLCTRIKSLTNGLNGLIFSSNEIDNDLLFNENVVIDLSRIGSVETKSLIMGILIMRLNEYRMSHATGMNASLKHITVLEEAHNILKRTSTEQNMDGANMVGKAVEMIANAIAEMRTYGEGFIIADQSPTSVDLAAIKNTNTKIIMRLPDENDRRLVGKAAALKDNQLDEIARLQKGVAVVYQNDWVEAVLCKVSKYDSKEQFYEFKPNNMITYSVQKKVRTELLNLLLKGRVYENIEPDIDCLKRSLTSVNLSTKNRIEVDQLVNEYLKDGNLMLWKDERFEQLSNLVSDILNVGSYVEEILYKEKKVDSITTSLTQFAGRHVSMDSEDMKMTVCQCLLAHAVAIDQSKIETYKEWHNFIINSVK